MNSKLLFDFAVDKENKTIQVIREFDAALDVVWRAWTESELLDQWWGPKPWRAETKLMDFREGGHWLYAMVGPENEKHWSKASYLSIKSKKSFTARDGFSDEDGVMNPEFPQNLWESHFSATDNNQTRVDVMLTFDSMEDLEKTIEMGFKEGFTMGLQQLDELLSRKAR